MAANDVTTDLMLGFSSAMTKSPAQALSFPQAQVRPSSQALTALPAGAIDARTLGILRLSSVLQAKEADVPRHTVEEGSLHVGEQQQILQHVLNHQLRLHLQQLSAANVNQQPASGLQSLLAVSQGDAFQRGEAPAFGPSLVSATTSHAQTTASGDTLLTAKPVVAAANPATQVTSHAWGMGHPAIISNTDDVSYETMPRPSSWH